MRFSTVMLRFYVCLVLSLLFSLVSEEICAIMAMGRIPTKSWVEICMDIWVGRFGFIKANNTAYTAFSWDVEICMDWLDFWRGWMDSNW